MTFDPLVEVLLIIFQLGTGRHSIRLEKMTLGCKFHILGIKTTLGQHIAKNLPVYNAVAGFRSTKNCDNSLISGSLY